MDALNMVKTVGKGIGYPVSPEEEVALRGVAGIMTFPSATIYIAAKILDKALENHAEMLNKAAIASEKHARSLKWATWALVAATLVLAAFAFLSIWCHP